MNRAAGIEQALRDDVDDGRPWLEAAPNLPEEFATLFATGAIDLLHITAPLTGASDEELDAARDIAHRLIEHVRPVVLRIEQEHAADVAGLGSVREFLAAKSSSDRVLLIRWILTTRQLWWPEDAPVGPP